MFHLIFISFFYSCFHAVPCAINCVVSIFKSVYFCHYSLASLRTNCFLSPRILGIYCIFFFSISFHSIRFFIYLYCSLAILSIDSLVAGHQHHKFITFSDIDFRLFLGIFDCFCIHRLYEINCIL